MKKEKNLKRIGNKGFSIVEIIIVMAIIAILTGALAPQMIKYIDKAKKSSDVQTANTIALAVNVTIANEYTATNQSLTTLYNADPASSFQKEIKDTVGSTKPTLKYIKGTNNDFYIVVSGNEVKIYAAPSTTGTTYTAVPADMLYPTVGENYR